jgi:ABC-type multidrug transport system fused ATPase/permease subunit
MFDILGYWVAVTFFTAIIILSHWWWVIFISDLFIYKVTCGEYKDFLYNKLKKKPILKPTIADVDEGIIIVLFVSIVFSSLSTLGFMDSYKNEGLLPYQIVSILAEKSYSLFSWVLILLICWYILVYSSRFIYKIYKAVKKLQEKSNV